MIADARDLKFEMIITNLRSRFGRNTLDCLNSIRELSELGIDVYFEKETIHTIKSENALKDYRAGELKRLLLEYDKIDEIKLELVKQTLDHISVYENGEVDVIFLYGSKVNC